MVFTNTLHNYFPSFYALYNLNLINLELWKGMFLELVQRSTNVFLYIIDIYMVFIYIYMFVKTGLFDDGKGACNDSPAKINQFIGS